MDPNEARVKSFLEDKGLTAEGFTKLERRAGKTPDFRVSKAGELVFYCEVNLFPKIGSRSR